MEEGSTRWIAASAPGCRSRAVRRAAAGPRGDEAAGAAAADFTSEASDEVCSPATRWSSAGAERPLTRLLALPEHRESRTLPARGRGPVPARRRRALPDLWCDGWRCPRGQARPLRPLRRLRPLSGLRLHQEGRPAAPGAAVVRGDLPHLPPGAPRCPPGTPHRLGLLGLLALPGLPIHDLARAARPDHDPDDGPLGRVDSDSALCSLRGDVPLAGESLEPAADRRRGAEPGGPGTPAGRRGGRGSVAGAPRSRRSTASRPRAVRKA